MEQNNKKKKRITVVFNRNASGAKKTTQKQRRIATSSTPVRPLRVGEPCKIDENVEAKKKNSNENNNPVKSYKPKKEANENREMHIVSEETWDKMSDSEKTSEYRRVLSEYVEYNDETIKTSIDAWNGFSEKEKLKEYKDTVYSHAMDFYLSTQTGINQYFYIGDWEMFSLDDTSKFESYFFEQMEEDGYYDTDEEPYYARTSSNAPLSAAEIDEELNVMGYDSSDVDGMSLEERRAYIEYLKNQE